MRETKHLCLLLALDFELGRLRRKLFRSGSSVQLGEIRSTVDERVKESGERVELVDT